MTSSRALFTLHMHITICEGFMGSVLETTLKRFGTPALHYNHIPLSHHAVQDAAGSCIYVERLGDAGKAL